jgi:hypothetical protein
LTLLAVPSAAQSLSGWAEGATTDDGVVQSADAALTAVIDNDGVWELESNDGATVALLLDTDLASAASVSDGLAVLERATITEFISQARDGIEHLFIVDEPLVQPLRIMTLGLTPELANATTINLVGDGVVRMTYGKLYAFDDNGVELSAWFHVEGGDIVIHVDDSDAQYPIVVDPLAQTPTFQRIPGAYPVARTLGPGQVFPNGSVLLGDGEHGWAVATVDYDNDTYDDIVVSAPRACGNTFLSCQVDEGLIEIYRGGPNGVSQTPTVTLYSDRAGAQMGRSLAAGLLTPTDPNNKRPIIVAGAPTATDVQANEGMVYVFRYDSASGTWPRIELQSNVANEQLGKSVALADVDTVAGGVVDIAASGVNRVRVWRFNTINNTLTVSGTMLFTQTLGMIAGVRDNNGDGDDELAISVPEFPATTNGQFGLPRRNGGVYVYAGTNSTVPTNPFFTTTNTIPCPGFTVAANEGVVYNCGGSLSSGDFNGDGRGDLLVGDTSYNFTTEGRTSARFETHVFHVGVSGVYPQTPSWTRTNTGTSVAGLGDLNQDGADELGTCLSSGFSMTSTDAGTCTAFSGRAIAPGAGPETPVRFTLNGTTNERLGDHHGMLAGGYLDNETLGYLNSRANDLVIGSYNAGQSGSTRAFRGTPAGPSGSSTSIETDANLTKAGDLVVLADLNSDGRDDVIVGAPQDGINGINAGAVRIYLSNPNFINSGTPDWEVRGQAGERYGSGIAVLRVSATEKRLVIGAPGSTRAFVYRWVGFIDDNTPEQTITSTFSEFGQALANVGNAYNTTEDALAISALTPTGPSVRLYRFTLDISTNVMQYNHVGSVSTPVAPVPGATCGQLPLALAGSDVSGDGFTDLLLGDASCVTAAVFRGNQFISVLQGSGIVNAAFWSRIDPDEKSEFGRSIAGAGDMNGDGVKDFVVGAPRRQGPADRDGGAFIYGGASTTANVSQVALLEAGTFSLAGAFGFSVAGGADVNRDGYTDVIIGAPTASTTLNGNAPGGILLVRGTKNGPKAFVGDFIVTGTNERFGASVAMGNCNADEYGDIAVGSPLTTNGSTNEGRVRIRFGSW